MADKKKNEELNEEELDSVTGGAGGKNLLDHELTHTKQQPGGSKYVGETEKNFSFGVERDGDGKNIVASGGGSGI